MHELFTFCLPYFLGHAHDPYILGRQRGRPTCAEPPTQHTHTPERESRLANCRGPAPDDQAIDDTP
jgi:hypothetical protein